MVYFCVAYLSSFVAMCANNGLPGNTIKYIINVIKYAIKKIKKKKNGIFTKMENLGPLK
jgi:hypothetical protein